MRPPIMLATLAIAGLSCGGGVSDPAAEEIVATIHLSSEPTINVREQRTLSTEFRDASGRMLIGVENVTWSSSDAGTVSVDGTGTVQGIKAGGPVTITAKQGSATGSVSISVVPTIRMQPTAALLGVDSTRTFTVSYVDFYGVAIGNVVATGWSSSNVNVATVDATGRVTGVAPGDATISATVLGAQQSASVEVGAPTPFDGTWTGTPYPNPGLGFGSVATITVTYGAVRAFELSFNWNFLPSSGTTITCQAHVTANGRYPVTSGAFSFASPFATTISGQFTDEHAGTLTWGAGMSVPASSFACPIAYTPLGAVSAGTRTFTLTR